MSVSKELKLDFQRAERIGFDEAIFCQGKTHEHLAEILEQAASKQITLLLTRLSREQFEALPPNHRERVDYEPLSRTGFYGTPPLRSQKPRTAIVAAGTSDAFVTREVARTLRYYGEPSSEFIDVGAAGLWRLQARLEEIRKHPVVIVVAGMDAVLPTVVGGLVSSVVIGVPTSNGYGVAAGGLTALHTILASCAPGICVLNIDNGFGAACAALRVLHHLPPAE